MIDGDSLQALLTVPFGQTAEVMSFIHVSATSRLLHGNTNFTTTEWEAVTRHRKSRINHPASFLVYRIIIRIIHMDVHSALYTCQ